MVRLCVPAGEDQHDLTREERLASVTGELSLREFPFRACIFATVVTAGASIVGLARPGTFLRNAAFFGTFEGVCTVSDIYGRQELNRAVFKLEGLENPKPFKLWERTKQWTLDDASLFGAATGLLVASNPRLMPGATGISRFFGAAVAGWAIGAKTAEFAIGPGTTHQTSRMKMLRAMQRRAYYKRLSLDDESKNSLSLFGKILLMSYTSNSPFVRILSNPLGSLTGVANPGNARAIGHGHNDTQIELTRRMDMVLANAKQPVLMAAEFEAEELAVPDYNRGHRQYHMDAADTDLEAVEEHLENLNRLRVEDAKDLAFIWQELAPKEHKMHRLTQEDPEKDLIRRELQLLNSIGMHSSIRLAVIGYAQADARKRLAQIRNEDPSAVSKLPLPGLDELLLDSELTKTGVPQTIVARIRRRWEELRIDAARGEHISAQLGEMKARGALNTHSHKQFDLLREHQKQRNQNVIATERLLKEFEDRIYKSDAGTGR